MKIREVVPPIRGPPGQLLFQLSKQRDSQGSLGSRCHQSIQVDTAQELQFPRAELGLPSVWVLAAVLVQFIQSSSGHCLWSLRWCLKEVRSTLGGCRSPNPPSNGSTRIVFRVLIRITTTIRYFVHYSLLQYEGSFQSRVVSIISNAT